MRLNVEITDELNSRLNEESKKLGLTKSALVISILNSKFATDDLQRQFVEKLVDNMSSADFIEKLAILNKKSD